MAATADLAVGKNVTISRDETKYPSKGTWPKYRGLKGVITTIIGHRRPRLVEYGVTFDSTRDPVWFLRHELEVLNN